jgi:plasmid maintenance system antidote protein VapI
MAIARTRPLAEPAPHPGEMLREELEGRGLSPHALAIALRLARYFGGSPAIWLRLQVAHDLARAEAELAAKIKAEVTPAAA